MIRKTIFSLLLLSLALSQVRIGDWESYTSPLNIRRMVETDNRIIAATDGGLLLFDQITQRFTTIDNIHGLEITDLACATLDPAGDVWIGGAEPRGIIQRYDLERRESLAVFDYHLSEVIDLAATDSLVFGIVRQNQDLGLIEFQYGHQGYFYRDVYHNRPMGVGELSGVAIFEDWVIVGTDQGVFSGNWRHSNLKDPASWNLLSPELDGKVTTLHQYGHNLLLVMDKVIQRIDLRDLTITWTWDNFADSYQFLDVVETDDGAVWGILTYTLIKLGQSNKQWQFHTPYRTANLVPLSSNSCAIGTNSGLAIVDSVSRSAEKILPNAPLTNQMSAVTVLDDGRIVAASKRGLAIKEDWGWRNIVEDNNITAVHDDFNPDYFAADTLPIDFGGFVADIEQGPDGLVYCAIRGTYPVPNPNNALRGGGIIVIDVDNPLNYTLIDTAVLDYFTTRSDPRPYMVVKDLEFDAQGNLWVADTYSINEARTLHVLDTNGNWGSFVADQLSAPLGSAPNSIAFDRWNNVWIGSELWTEGLSTSTNGGLVKLDYSGNPADADVSSWHKQNFDDKSAISVWSLVYHPNDILYALTPEGMYAFRVINSAANPTSQINVNNYFAGISFGSGSIIKRDPQNNIWSASPTQGIHVLLENTTYWPDIEGLQQSNSKLLSDEVTDIEFDQQGFAVIATKAGINRLRIPFSHLPVSYQNLRVFPSPFRIPNSKSLVIDGVIAASTAMIMTLTGSVVKTIKATTDHTGNQLTWDGRDESGRLVNSGVYLIAIYSSEGSEASVTKVAVIRH